jgi:hypothetical protein
MKEALSSSDKSVLTEPHDVTSQKTPFFIVAPVKASNLTMLTKIVAMKNLRVDITAVAYLSMR